MGSPARSDSDHVSVVSQSSAHSESNTPSPRVLKRQHDVARESDDDEVFEVKVIKAQKTSSGGRPKAGDYEDSAKDLILSAANTYRALLVSQGAFPTSAEEIELVKRSWKRVNDDSGMNPMALTPDIVRIVSNFTLIISPFGSNVLLRSRLEALRPVVRRRPRRQA